MTSCPCPNAERPTWPEARSTSGTSRSTALARPGVMVDLAGAVDGRQLPIGCCIGSEMNSGVLPEAMRAGRGSVPTWKSEA